MLVVLKEVNEVIGKVAVSLQGAEVVRYVDDIERILSPRLGFGQPTKESKAQHLYGRHLGPDSGLQEPDLMTRYAGTADDLGAALTHHDGPLRIGYGVGATIYLEDGEASRGVAELAAAL